MKPGPPLVPVQCDDLVGRGSDLLFRIPAERQAAAHYRDAGGNLHACPVEDGFPIHGLRVRSATILYPNLLFPVPGAVLDSGNGYSSTELCVHGLADYPLVAVYDGNDGGFHVALQVAPMPAYPIPRGTNAVYLAAVSNYSSWLLGELPRAVLARRIDAQAKIVLHGEVRPFQIESLHAAGVAAGDIIHVPSSAAVVGDVTWISPTYFHQAAHPLAIGETRRLRENVAAAARIYVSRSAPTVTMRRIVNEPELETLLRDRHAFEVIRPESLSFAAQKRHFSGAAWVVAPFGAALANVVFMPEGAALAMIATKDSHEFTRLASHVGVGVTVIPAEFRVVREGRNQSETREFVVDPQAVSDAIRPPLSAAGA